ncbi:DNA alkylation repair protein [Phenylobacterium terrae]|uniref:DNA alkylation repair protein n=1 Tax=Phenylobacterium terrae TaxID=2665495 RepID=A0ABW4N3Y0_9CAUL
MARDADVEKVLQALQAEASDKVRDEMGPRYGIVTPKAMGVPMNRMQAIAKRLGRDHELAEALWETGWYEARTVAALIDDPGQVTPAQMDRWRADFDNWAIVDTVCFKLFDQSPHAFARIDAWATLNDEMGRRAGFALLACVALHGRGGDADYLSRLPLIEAAATDSRNFVKKAVNWALRAIGGKKSPALRAAARELADRLAASPDRTARWIGRDAQKAFAKADAKAAG